MDYLFIPGTVSLDRLKIENSASRRLAATAMDTLGFRGFVLLDDLGTTLLYQGLFSQDYDENITDLAFTSSTLVTVSEFRNDDNLFALRDGDIMTIFDIGIMGNLTQFDTRYRYSTTGINTITIPRPSAPTSENTHDIRVASIPGTDKVVIAYEGVGGGFDTECGVDEYNTNLYEFNLPYSNPQYPINPIMVGAQVVSLNKYFTNGFQDIISIPGTTTIALLYKNTIDITKPAGEIQYPELTSFGQKHRQLICADEPSDMDFFSTNQLQFIGRNISSSHLVHFTQNILQLTPSCLPLLYCNTEEMNTIENSQTNNGMRKTSILLDWSSSLTLSSRNLIVQNTCTVR